MASRKNLEQPLPVAQILEGLLRPGDWRALEIRQKIRAAWEQVVPERHRRQSRLIDLKRGVLWVEAASSALVQELQFLRPRIQAALDKALGVGVIKEIRFQVGGG
ncbi:MAG: DUF721 domain-containing protein [Desulfobaccales bacterium]